VPQGSDDLKELFGPSLQLAECWTADVPPDQALDNAGLLSTVKIRQAGFTKCVDSREMFSRYVARFKELRMIPSV